MKLDTTTGSPLLRSKIGVQYTRTYESVDEAVALNNWDAVPFLLLNGAPILNYTDTTTLIARHGKYTYDLLSRPDITTMSYRHILTGAIEGGHRDIIRDMVERGKYIRYEDICNTVSSNNIEMLEYLLYLCPYKAHIREAVYACIEQGSIDMMIRVLTLYPTVVLCSDAVDVAIEHNNIDAITWLNEKYIGPPPELEDAPPTLE